MDGMLVAAAVGIVGLAFAFFGRGIYYRVLKMAGWLVGWPIGTGVAVTQDLPGRVLGPDPGLVGSAAVIVVTGFVVGAIMAWLVVTIERLFATVVGAVGVGAVGFSAASTVTPDTQVAAGVGVVAGLVGAVLALRAWDLALMAVTSAIGGTILGVAIPLAGVGQLTGSALPDPVALFDPVVFLVVFATGIAFQAGVHRRGRDREASAAGS